VRAAVACAAAAAHLGAAVEARGRLVGKLAVQVQPVVQGKLGCSFSGSGERGSPVLPGGVVGGGGRWVGIPPWRRPRNASQEVREPVPSAPAPVWWWCGLARSSAARGRWGPRTMPRRASVATDGTEGGGGVRWGNVSPHGPVQSRQEQRRVLLHSSVVQSPRSSPRVQAQSAGRRSKECSRPEERGEAAEGATRAQWGRQGSVGSRRGRRRNAAGMGQGSSDRRDRSSCQHARAGSARDRRRCWRATVRRCDTRHVSVP